MKKTQCKILAHIALLGGNTFNPQKFHAIAIEVLNIMANDDNSPLETQILAALLLFKNIKVRNLYHEIWNAKWEINDYNEFLIALLPKAALFDQGAVANYHPNKMNPLSFPKKVMVRLQVDPKQIFEEEEMVEFLHLRLEFFDSLKGKFTSWFKIWMRKNIEGISEEKLTENVNRFLNDSDENFEKSITLYLLEIGVFQKA